MRLFNTLSREKEEFTPLKKTVGLYSCGPTVYNYAHVGNLRTYIFVDVLKRVLAMNGFKVKHVMNITDVGHLTSDADEGEDKLEKGAAREGKGVWEIAKKYTQAFKDDLETLNIKPPGVWARAAEHIKEQIALIKKLEAKGFAYETPRALYFDTAKAKDYGKLARLRLADQKEGAGERAASAVETDPEKKHPADFVLWFKRVGKYKDHAMHWPSPWGDGFPGWHIECSAMSMKYLGETFDVHTGGIDHIGVHHTNEIAQSESATGKPFVRYWLHGAFLVFEGGEKMAKSGEQFVTLTTLVGRGFHPLSLRYLALTAHYRSPLTFSWEALKAAEAGLKNLYAAITRVRAETARKSAPKTTGAEREAPRAYKARFFEAVNDDLNTPQALAALWDAMKDRGLSAKEKLALAEELDEVLGLGIADVARAYGRTPKKVAELVARRERLRAEKRFAESDEVRKEIESAGFVIDDTLEGPLVMKGKSAAGK